MDKDDNACRIEYDPVLKHLLRIDPPYAVNVYKCLVRDGNIVIPEDVGKIKYYIPDDPDLSFVPKAGVKTAILGILGRYDLFRVRWKLHDIIAAGVCERLLCDKRYPRDAGEYLEEVYEKVKGIPEAEEFVKNRIIWLARRIHKFLYEMGSVIDSINDAIDDFFDDIEKHVDEKDREKLEKIYEEYVEKLDKLIELARRTGEKLQFGISNHDVNIILNALKEELDKIDEILHVLPGDTAMYGEIDRYTDEIIDILSKNKSTVYA